MTSPVPSEFSIEPVPAMDDPSRAVLWGGRCLARLSWHLQQGWLLASCEDTKVKQQQAQHITLSFRAFDSMAAIVHGWDIADSGRLSQQVLQIKRDADHVAFPDGIFDAVTCANSEWITCQREGFAEELCRNIVGQYVDPVIQQLRNLLSTSLAPPTQNLFDLGVCIEEGACRPDVHQFVGDYGLWQNLRMNEELAKQIDECGEISEKDLFDGDDDDENTKTAEKHSPSLVIAKTSRQPADLAPQEAWLKTVPITWNKSGISAGLPASWIEFTRAYRRRRITCDTVRHVVHDLYATAYTLLGGSPIRVSLDPPTVTYQNMQYQTDLEVALLFKELTSNDPPRSFKQFVEKHRQDLGFYSRLDRIKKKMPLELAKLIVSGKGTSLRLLLE